MKRNLLSMALASATLMLATAAHAQDTPPPPQQAQPDQRSDEDAKTLDTVTVTGIRASIEKSIDTKQSSTSIVEAISAEDIGKLPDTSIADSIARLPGLTAQRFGNRPQEINIRGFAGDFSTALLNGREQVSPGNNRGVEFDQYPSELINSVVVYKTPDGSLIGQGLSGTIDLHTVRPLDFKEPVVALNLRGDMNEIEHDDDKLHGSRFSASYIDQFADNTVGLALGYAQLNNPTQSHVFEGWGYDSGVINGGNIFDVEGDNTRKGFMGVLEFRPNEMYSTTLDLFYSKFDREETKRGFQFSTGGTGNVVSREGDADLATRVQFQNVNFGVIRNDVNASYDDLFAIGWNHQLRLNDQWTLRADISNSSTKREERILETYARLAPGVEDDNVVATHNPDGYFDFDFSLDLTDPANFLLMDPGGWGGDRAQAGYLKDFDVTDNLTSVRFDLERTFDEGMFSSLEFGVNLTDRKKTRSSFENTLCLTVGCTSAENQGMAIPPQYITSSDLNFAGITFLGLDALGLLNDVYILNPKNHPDISKKNWDVHEEVTTLYVQGNINTDLGPVPVRGNVGLQVVNAQQSSDGFQSLPLGASGGPVSDSASFTHYLPSLNLSFQLPWDQYLRFGAARQMARPRMDELRVNNDIAIDFANPPNPNYPDEFQVPHYAMTGGNTQLEPWLANAYDLSWEMYFGGSKGYVSAAYFFKDLKTYIYTQEGFFDIRDTAFPPNLIDPSLSPIGRFSRPANGTGGYVRGHEIAVSIPLDLLWEPLLGFGIQANYADNDSSIQPYGPTRPNEPLPGLSKYVTNGTVYFERWGFAARVSARHRSDFVGEVQGFGGDREKRVFGAETVTDVQLGYTLQSGPMKDLSFLLQVNNLENEPYQTLDGSGRPNTFSEYGRTYLLGVNYKF
ncbi:TonB-dependent receptor [Agrilutibacter solisilvae]|uniref:TonB-dependent receptor n=1 Tax=Agrilutibacter solisilvae TaxID=2763317 RepID=A0A974Y0U8_9GAMM|nr:TonB-dependent receptor [Lysobacter solisilvae]QSX79337.1 TonB-dependent receptor [Lysobacter solisilvae]